MSERDSLGVDRCESTSPILRNDLGEIRCELRAGHEGDHSGRNYDVSYEAAPLGYQVRRWNDDRRVTW